MSTAKQWLTYSGSLALAVLWRIRRERAHYFFFAVMPLAAVLTILCVLPSVVGDRNLNGAASAAVVGMRYGARHNAVTIGILLTLVPGLIGLFNCIGIARVTRGLIGGEASRGGIEALLGAPYTPGSIAAALLGCTSAICVATWLLMSVLSALAIFLLAVTNGDHLTPSPAYLALATALPLFTSLAGTALALLAGLLFPRLTQLRAMANLAGGNLGSAGALLPAFGVILALALGGASIGPLRLLLIAGGSAVVIAAGAVTIVALKFKPESVLEA